MTDLISGKPYQFKTRIKDCDPLRQRFNEMTRQVFGFDFEAWYQAGYWDESYRTYALFDGEEIVANVSASQISFDIQGCKRNYVQLGTVMTRENYRGLGLSRFLLDLVLSEWQNRCDLIYLFANASVLDFYPKFGFEALVEYRCERPVGAHYPSGRVRRLDLSAADSQILAGNKIRSARPVAKLSMLPNLPLIQFYLMSIMNNQVYYLEDLEAIAVAEYKGDTLYLQDVFCEQKIRDDLDDVVCALATAQTRRAVFCFTPRDSRSCLIHAQNDGLSTLFAIGRDCDLLKKSQLMFPLLSHT